MIEYTVRVFSSGNKYWYLNRKLHREDGPATEYANGTKFWYLNGKLHREDGPAVEHANGAEFWYLDGKLHREDGPATECADGEKSWYLNGIEMTQEEHEKRINPCLNKTITITIDGVEYNLVRKES